MLDNLLYILNTERYGTKLSRTKLSLQELLLKGLLRCCFSGGPGKDAFYIISTTGTVHF